MIGDSVFLIVPYPVKFPFLQHSGKRSQYDHWPSPTPHHHGFYFFRSSCSPGWLFLLPLSKCWDDKPEAPHLPGLAHHKPMFPFHLSPLLRASNTTVAGSLTAGHRLDGSECGEDAVGTQLATLSICVFPACATRDSACVRPTQHVTSSRPVSTQFRASSASSGAV